MSKEYKKYGIRTAPCPSKKESGLSTTVMVQDEFGNTYYCYIRFSPALEYALGKKLPRGVSELYCAYLHVFYDEKKWVVAARYADDGYGEILWTAPTMPAWVRLYESRGLDASGKPTKGIRGRTTKEARLTPKQHTDGILKNYLLTARHYLFEKNI